jgi:hypothetical protein
MVIYPIVCMYHTRTGHHPTSGQRTSLYICSGWVCSGRSGRVHNGMCRGHSGQVHNGAHSSLLHNGVCSGQLHNGVHSVRGRVCSLWVCSGRSRASSRHVYSDHQPTERTWLAVVMSHIRLTLETAFMGWRPLWHHSAMAMHYWYCSADYALPLPFHALYALPPLFCALYTPASNVPRCLHRSTSSLQYRQFCLRHLHVSVSIISTSDERPHPVNPFRQWTYYPKALRPWQLTKYGLQVIKMGIMVTSRCKGNLTDLRRELHLSLAKGNPKRML